MRRIGLLLCLLLFACTHDRTESVTGTGSSVRLTLALEATTSNAIQRARLLFDEREIAVVEPAGGAAQARFDVVVNGVEHGRHVIRIVIDRQATTPGAYRLSGSITAVDRILDLAPVDAVLSTGQSVDLQVSL